MNRSEVTTLRAVVRRIDDTVCKLASGLALCFATLGLVQASCEELRAADLDERTAFFVGVIERSAAMIQKAEEGLGITASANDLGSAEIELPKSVWNLDAHLLAVAASDGKSTRSGVAVGA